MLFHQSVRCDNKKNSKMYGAEVIAKRANYYSPVRQEAPPCRNKNVPDSCYATRILGRRYALTTTGYKYLEIGINVGPVPTVEIVIGDNRGNQLLLHTETWKEMIRKRADIQQLLEADTPSFSPLWIRDLSVEFCKISDSKIVKLKSHTTCLYLKPATMNILFSYEYCMDHMYAWLSENTHVVSLKFNNFVNVLREKNVTEMRCAANALYESVEFDCESLIDCELLASALKNIMYEAAKK